MIHIEIQFLFLVPPEIIDEQSSPSLLMIEENTNVSLKCAARGHPTPKVFWKREDLKPIITSASNTGEFHIIHVLYCNRFYVRFSIFLDKS